MEPSYYLYSGRNQGWLTLAGNYASDLAEALIMGRSEALARCRKHKSDAGYQLIPVSVDDMRALS